MFGMLFRVLGPVEIEADDGRVLRLRRRQERLLLGILLLEAGHTVPVARLAGLLWEDNAPERAVPTLHSYASRIRAILTEAGGGAPEVSLVSDRSGYQLRVPPDTLDVYRFRRLVADAAETGDPAGRERLLRAGLALWRGPALHDAASPTLRARLCAELDELHLGALEDCLSAGMQLGRDRELLPELTRLAGEHPLRERLVHLRMLALYRLGRSADALDLYTHTRGRLADELGLDPGAELRDLHRAILRGEPVPASAPAPSATITGPGAVAPAQLPPDLSGFAGRAAHLERLDGLLPGRDRPGPSAVVTVIAGTAGVGKTALAVHWAHRVRDRFPDGQVYINLRGFDPGGTPTPPEQALRLLLDALNVPAERIPADNDARVGLYRSVLAGKRVLIVLDNARDADQVRPLLPGAPGCLTVVTSRSQLTGLVAIDGAYPLIVDLLTRAEATELLAARIGAERVITEPDAVDALITLCAHLPLALAIVAARIATQPKLSLTAVAERLRAARGTFEGLTGDDPATDIRAVFAHSYQLLSPAAARLFRLLGLHPGPDTSAAAAASLAGIAPDETVAPLAELTRAHLLDEHRVGRYAFHDLLRVYAAERANEEELRPDLRTARCRLLDHYLHSSVPAALILRASRDPLTVAPPSAGVRPEVLETYAEAMRWFDAEHRVLLGAVDRAAAEGFDVHAWQLTWALGDYLDWRGLWHERLAAQQTALAAARRLGDTAAQAYAHRGLGGARMWLGAYHDALAHLRRALALYGEIGDDALQAQVHLNIAGVLVKVDQTELGLRHTEQGLELFRRVGRPSGIATGLGAVSWFQAQVGDHAAALASGQEALALFVEMGDRRGEAQALEGVAAALRNMGEFERSYSCYERSAGYFRDLGDPYHQGYMLNQLGDAHEAAGDHAGARESWQRALTIFIQLNHVDAEDVRAKLSDLSRSQA